VNGREESGAGSGAHAPGIADELGYVEGVIFLHHIEQEEPGDLDVHMIVDNYGTRNQHPHLFKWTDAAESILAELQRLGNVICGTEH
jgi:hypothetical protein